MEQVYIVDDDTAVRQSLGALVESIGLRAALFASAAELLAAISSTSPGCLVLDIRMPGMSGMELQRELTTRDIKNPIIFITGHGDVAMAVQAMRAGAHDFIEKPFREQILLDCIHAALTKDRARRETSGDLTAFRDRVESLTPREREVMTRIVNGQANKVIAIELGLSERTVEIHRAKVMTKTCTHSLAELVSLVARASV